jgi:hypothetical protein
MNKIFLVCGFLLGFMAEAMAGAIVPKAPTQMPAATAVGYINNYKDNMPNYFAHGYLLEISKVKSMSSTATRVYNALQGTNKMMIITPLTSSFNVNTGASSFAQTEGRLCPKLCDIVSDEVAVQVAGGEVNTCVNTCLEGNNYEPVNAMVVFTSTLTALGNAGYKFVRMYNGMDATGKRYVVYVPVDNDGRDVIAPGLFVGDASNTLTNCKYP